jgi:hypothetical protein
MSLYDGIDPFDVCMSALALALVSGLTQEDVWVACTLAGNAGEFDVAVQASCRLKEIVEEHGRI